MAGFGHLETGCDLCFSRKILNPIPSLYRCFLFDVVTKIHPLGSQLTDLKDEHVNPPKQACSKCTLKLYNFFSFVEMCRNSILNKLNTKNKLETKSFNIEVHLGERIPSDSYKTNDTKRQTDDLMKNSESWLQTIDHQLDDTNHEDKNIKAEPDSEIVKCELGRESLGLNGLDPKCDPKYEDYNDDFFVDGEFDEEDIKPIIESCKDEIKKRRKFKCTVCLKVFKSLKTLRNHKTKHNKEKLSHQCSYCSKKFKTATALRNHERVHETDRVFKCQLCDKKFSCATSLMRHEFEHRKEGTLARLKPAKTKCAVCNGVFAVRYMDIHMRRHTGVKPFLCAHCPKQFHTKSLLREHVKSHEERQNLCTLCGKKFARSDHLKIHLKRHNGEKPHKCKYCNKGFARFADMAVHVLYHTDEKKHLCNLCGKGFHRPYNLKVHQRVHTGERPYKCQHCAQSFSQGYDLTTHVRRKHTGEKYKCDMCDTGFYQKYYLTRHKAKDHGVECNSSGRVKKYSKSDDPASGDIKTEDSTDNMN